MRVLVTGATGTVGRRLLPLLLTKEIQVRALTRNPKAQLTNGPEVVIGDLSKPETLSAAFADVSSLFLLSDGEDLAAKDQIAIQAAQAAGVKHIVKLSVLSATYGAKDPITRWHVSGENVLRKSGLDWTFLRANGFMTNALNWTHSINGGGTIFAPFASDRTSIVDPDDIAAMAATALTEPGHTGKAYGLTGPEGLSIREQAGILSEELSKPVSVIEISAEAAVANLTRYGMTEPLAAAVIAMFASARDSRNGKVSPDIEQVLGRTPGSFRAWVKQNIDRFSTTDGSREDQI